MLLLALAIAPTMAIMVYIYNKKRYDKEPKLFLFKLFFFGILMVIPTALIEGLLISDIKEVQNGSLLSIFLHSFIGIALVEEGFKYMAFRLGIKRSKSFNQMYDSIVYSVFVSLGFATIENIMYVLTYGKRAGIIRAITAVPGHAIFGITMGYYFGMATFAPVASKKKTYIIMSLVIPVLLHGIYDFILLSKHIAILLVFYPFMAYLYISGMKKTEILCKMDNYNRRLQNCKEIVEKSHSYQNFSFEQYDPYHYHTSNTNLPINYDCLNKPSQTTK